MASSEPKRFVKLTVMKRLLVIFSMLVIAGLVAFGYATSRDNKTHIPPVTTVKQQEPKNMEECIHRAQNLEAQQTIIDEAIEACRKTYPSS